MILQNATMSVDVIKDMNLDKDCNKSYDNSRYERLIPSWESSLFKKFAGFTFL